jgi:hypothetical protein
MASLDELEKKMREASLKPKPGEPKPMVEVVTSDDQSYATQKFLQSQGSPAEMSIDAVFSPSELYVKTAGVPDHKGMIKFLRSSKPEFEGDNPCCVVSSVHTGIVVKDNTPSHLFTKKSISETTGVEMDVDFKDPNSLKEWGVPLTVPAGMKVFVVLLSTESCVYHHDYNIDRVGKYFDGLKQVMTENGLTLTTNDFIEYGKAVCDSTYQFHTEAVSRAASDPSLVGKKIGAQPTFAFESAPLSHRYKIFESGTETHPYEMNLAINAGSPNQLGVLYSDPTLKSKVIYDKTSVPPGKSYVGFHLSEITGQLYDAGHTTAVFIFNGCATKRYFDFGRSAPLFSENALAPSGPKPISKVGPAVSYTIDAFGNATTTFQHDSAKPRDPKGEFEGDSDGGKKSKRKQTRNKRTRSKQTRSKQTRSKQTRNKRTKK